MCADTNERGQQGDGQCTTIEISRRLISISVGNRAGSHAAIACYYYAESLFMCADTKERGQQGDGQCTTIEISRRLISTLQGTELVLMQRLLGNITLKVWLWVRILTWAGASRSPRRR